MCKCQSSVGLAAERNAANEQCNPDDFYLWKGSYARKNLMDWLNSHSKRAQDYSRSKCSRVYNTAIPNPFDYVLSIYHEWAFAITHEDTDAAIMYADILAHTSPEMRTLCRPLASIYGG